MRSDPSDHSEQMEQGRIPTRTRRMSKGSGLLEDGEVAKSSAEHSLSHGVPKLTAVQPAKGRQTAVRLPDSTENHLNYENIQIVKEDTEDMKQLKELILSHLDLIQQQQELLSAKDRQIQSLKSERDTLRCRLERMERRMSLVRQQGEPLEKLSPSPGVPSRHRERERVSHVRSSSPARTSTHSSPVAQQRGSKRKSSQTHLEETQIQKKRIYMTETASSSSFTESRPHFLSADNVAKKLYPRFGEYKRPVVNDSPGPRDHTSWPSYIRRKGVLEGDPDTMQETVEIMKSRKITFVNKEPPLCRTDNPYFVYVNDEDEDDEVKVSKKMVPEKEAVSVPGWRVQKIPTGFSMEGTENLDDDIFLKRHQKPEQEEKRRKRWDMQRMRDQSMYERLQQQQGRVSCSDGKDQGGSNLVSFWPDQESAKYIEVSDKVPVSAFGYPLPAYSKCEFDLPWFDLDKREQQEKHRNSRKKR